MQHCWASGSSSGAGASSDSKEHAGSIIIEVKLENVHKRYSMAANTALNDVSISIDSGEWVFLVGASGMGKTTVLKLLYREVLPDRGSVHVGGTNLADITGSRLRRSMGIIFQSFRLLVKKTALENIAYGAEVMSMPPALVRQKSRHILDLVGLADKAHRLPGELSGGEQQRVAIGRALINEPRLILADEPTGDLDPENSERVIQILDTVHREQKVTVLFATHAADVVDRLQRRVIRLKDGRVVSDAKSGYWNHDSVESE